MRATTLAKLEGLVRPFATGFLPPETVVRLYSQGRLDFIEQFLEELPAETYAPPEGLSRRLWRIDFRAQLMNAAGLDKNGKGYALMAAQGAGGYLGGTGTWKPWLGNLWDKEQGVLRLSQFNEDRRAALMKNGTLQPFGPYPRSGAASNSLGLPNDGDYLNSSRAEEIERVPGCPVGWSVAGPPDLEGELKLSHLVQSMELYQEAGVDFLEMNESCPNTGEGRLQTRELAARLRYVQEYFLDQRSLHRRTRPIPVIVKFSNDTKVEQVPEILDLLFKLEYDGVNFGNTSTDYKRRRGEIHRWERRLYDHFTSKIGGGVSGRPLKESSLELAARAVEYARAGPPSHEFHVIRTGGIETWNDIMESERARISLNQWFSGYFHGFKKHGHDMYRELFRKAEEALRLA